MLKNKRFRFSTVIAAAALVGFVGFGLGFNWTFVQDRLSARLRGGPAQAGLPEDLDYEDLEGVYDSLRQNYAGQLDAAKLVEGAKMGLVQATGDPYTTYLDEAAAQDFQESLDGTFSGIGAEIALKQERIVIVAPLAGSPAKAAGLQAGDVIAQIQGEATTDLTVEQAVAKIRGQAGTAVTLTIIRGNDPPRDINITRAVISVPSVRSELKPGNIGYIELSRFSEDSAAKVREAAIQLKGQGATRIILDLRNNPGGLLQSAVEIADEFMEEGKKVVEERREEKVIASEQTTPGGELTGLPAVVLINQGSASASEIIAGALQDNKVATVVGEQSFGKGSVQELIDLRGKAVLKVTIALWYTPNGRNITKEGIIPDIKVDLSDEDFNNDSDPQLTKALEILQTR